MEEVNLTTLGKLIEGCWNQAEAETAKAVAEKHHSPNEEEVTFLFIGELRTSVENASATGKVEREFLTDLRSVSGLDDAVARRARGLIARVNFHGRQHEGKKSASDVGIIIRRPLVRRTSYPSRVELHRDHAIGLLAQAKLGHCADLTNNLYTWTSGLTDNQVRLFPERCDYYSLLLYRLAGDKELRPFLWQLCKSHTVEEVKHWLHSDTFPQEVSSSHVIQKLFAGTIGTKNKEVIQTIIDAPPSAARFIDLHIFWPDDAAPPPFLQLQQHKQNKQIVQQLNRR
jgi:hypothetical protein